MSHAAPLPLRRLAPQAISRPDPVDEVLTMRLLRHHTKNALQRIIAQVSGTDLRATPAGAALADEIERRIRLSARVSDTLFGLTETPGPLADRLRTLTQSVVALIADPVQTIRTDVHLLGGCPPALESFVLQITHEFVTNAVKHGMHMRLTGEIDVTVEGKRPGMPYTGLTLVVRDDGWGAEQAGFGDGLSVLQLMADRHGGTVSLARDAGWTVARLRLPGAA